MGLNGFDVAVIVLYLACVTAFGMHFRKKQNTIKGYFLAEKSIPWWAISLSIVAAETSTLTIISVPGMAYEQDFRFLQLVIGYMIGRVIISLLLIPHYFRGDLVTAYQLIERRFGQRLRSLTAGLFLLTRAAADGVRVFAIAIVVGIALSGLLQGYSDLGRDIAAIAIVITLTLLFTFKGGMATVIWTDIVQLSVYLTGTVIGLFTIIHLVPGGWHAAYGMAAAAGKFHVFQFGWNFYAKYTFWSGIIGGAFLTTASHGTDQLIVMRLLASRSERSAKMSLVASGVLVLFQFALFLLIGALLYSFYKMLPLSTVFVRSDRIYPTFVVNYMPHGISGLLVSAILAAAMSNLSASLYSLSSTTIIDFYSRLNPGVGEKRRMFLSRMATIGWGVVLFALAIVVRQSGQKVLEIGLSIASVAYGSLLGVFMLGVLTRRASESGAMVGMVCGFALNLFLWQFTGVPYTWYVPLGSIVTFAIGYGASFFLRRTMPVEPATIVGS
ncbi:MAG: sodium:solute symporter [Terracidiphilus sp.]|jgi:SSS family transporter